MRADYDYDENDDPYEEDLDDELDGFEELDDEDEDIPPAGRRTDPGVDVSMEVDAQGNEVWYATDSRIPGSTSMGHSVEEAVDGVEERRKQFQEMLRRSREQRKQREDHEG